jgi:ABC-type transporter Mla subunit MlaD
MARKPMTKARAKRLIGIGTTVAPLLAPYALAAAGAVRGGWDSYRAGRLGVSADRLAEFTGPGGGLHARVSHLAEALTELAARSPAATEFAEQAQPRLAELATAVRAAEQMPGSRRRTAFKAISLELDGIEQGVLTHLGITT